MKPAPFRYLRPTSVEGAVEALAAYGDEAKPLAGGQSLLPMMNFRLARPSVLVDLERVEGLDRLASGAASVTIGAMARQARVAASPQIAQRLPLLATALRHVGHHQIRTRGTIGGSLAHADPAAEVPAVALLLEATLEAQGPRGSRSIPAASFFEGPFSTALADDELLTAVRFPASPGQGWAFEELARRSGDFAVAGVAAARLAGARRLVAFGLGWVPMRLTAAEAAMAAEADPRRAIEAAAAAARDEVEPTTDIHAHADYRREAVATLVRRALGALPA